MTNDECIAEAVERRCFGGHDQIQLLTSIAEACEKNSPRLVAAILRASRQSMRASRCGTRAGGTRSTANNRSTGNWTDCGGAGAVVTP